MSNSDHTAWGNDFQQKVMNWFTNQYDQEFKPEPEIKIGVPKAPKKKHKFDIANEDHSIVIECKRYTWTKTGNVPSAKIRSLNEAMFFLYLLPKSCRKVLAISRSTHPAQTETLAEYYVRTNAHLIGDVEVMEFDTEKNTMRSLNVK